MTPAEVLVALVGAGAVLPPDRSAWPAEAREAFEERACICKFHEGLPALPPGRRPEGPEWGEEPRRGDAHGARPSAACIASTPAPGWTGPRSAAPRCGGPVTPSAPMPITTLSPFPGRGAAPPRRGRRPGRPGWWAGCGMLAREVARENRRDDQGIL